MKIPEYSTREVQQILRRNGYTLTRTTKSSHNVYSNGKRNISIPVQNKTVNKMLFMRLVKENNLKID